MPQGGDEGLGVPVPEWSKINKALANRCPAGRLDHVGLERDLVNISQPFQSIAHEWLAACDPKATRMGQVQQHAPATQVDVVCPSVTSISAS